jgi:hypothetical protein
MTIMGNPTVIFPINISMIFPFYPQGYQLPIIFPYIYILYAYIRMYMLVDQGLVNVQVFHIAQLNGVQNLPTQDI